MSVIKFYTITDGMQYMHHTHRRDDAEFCTRTDGMYDTCRRDGAIARESGFGEIGVLSNLGNCALESFVTVLYG